MSYSIGELNVTDVRREIKKQQQWEQESQENQQPRKLISTWQTSHKHDSKDLNRLQ